MIAQYRPEEILRERLAEFGGHVELGAELVDITQDADGVPARLADGREITASWLVGCDGGHSAVCGDVEIDGPDRGFWTSGRAGPAA